MDTWDLKAYEHERKPQYMGCIGVKTSMRSLCYQTRSQVAKESINRLCEANNIQRATDKKRNDIINRMLDDEPNLLHSGTEVELSVTSTHLNVISKDTEQILFQHEMPNVSFASSGDEDTVDFVAYVAKDSRFGRACFVFECGLETAKDVLEKIARGFQLRTKQILLNNGTLTKNGNPMNHDRLANLNSILHSPDSHDASFKCNNNENQCNESVITATRTALEKESWFHGSYLSREQSETRLKHDGDFLVRESMLDPGHFVLSVMNAGTKLHLLFDSMGQVRTKEMVFKDISHMVKYHHDEGLPIVADKRTVYLRNGVRCVRPNTSNLLM